jgi:parallel beta-helix repeat protein
MKIQYDSLKKIFTLGIIIVFLGVCFYPADAQPVKQAFSSSHGNWLFVGGAGPGNYTKIQDAIDNASTGDTIYVYQGTYHEALIIDTWSLTIIGENRYTTIIETNTSDDTITIKKSDISIHGFTISGIDSGIYVRGEVSTIVISNNTFRECYRGVEFEYDWDNFMIILENNFFYMNHCGIYLVTDLWPITIRNNIFFNNDNGMEVSGTFLFIENNTFANSRGSGLSIYGEKSIIEGNVFQENGEGLSGGGEEHTIMGNWFLDNRVGLSLGGSKHKITGNLFKNNSFGVVITGVATTVSQNNFIQNEKDAWFAEENRSHGNIWDNNYWTDSFHLLGRTLIFGKIHTHIKKFLQFNPYETTYFWMPWINVDSKPAKDPFPIR